MKRIKTNVDFNGTNVETEQAVPEALNQYSTSTVESYSAQYFNEHVKNVEVDSQLSDTSENPVQNKIITEALAGKQDVLTFDDTPTNGSSNPVKSGGVYTALEAKQNVLTFDNVPTDGSSNPVKSGGVYSSINDINVKIPSQASSSNQLADKDFVNSSINSMASFYITRNAAGDPFQTAAQLASATTFYSGGEVRTPTRNDYCIVVADITAATAVDGYSGFTTTAQYVGYHILYNNEDTLVTTSNKDSLGITAGTTVCYYSIPTTRYTYQGSQWEYQYIVNDTSLTAAQIAAINSGITADLVNKLNGIESGAQVNDIETISVDGVAQTITNKNVNIILSSKLDKVTSSNTYKRAYTVSTSGTQEMTDIVSTAAGIANGDIAAYDGNGNLYANDPIADKSVINLQSAIALQGIARLI